jgi:hypothetical protein
MLFDFPPEAGIFSFKLTPGMYNRRNQGNGSGKSFSSQQCGDAAIAVSISQNEVIEFCLRRRGWLLAGDLPFLSANPPSA